MDLGNVERNACAVGVRFFSEEGKELSEAAIVLPLSTTAAQLQTLCNKLLDSSDDPIPVTFRTMS
ncbi:unnamed protein product, partial [Gongylonema pulchrum]|uniref:NLE domain-containing protein n=1 Tax=Gongylonema pulchrum TaxID=637853 RepID=A0A183ESF7_9BILA